MPFEIVLVFDLVLFAQLLDFEEDISLMYMNGNECLSLLSNQLVHVFETHVGEVFHDSNNISLLFLELLKLLFLTLLEAFFDLVSPKSLDTEKGNLRWVSCDEVFKGKREAVLATSLSNASDGSLHLVLEFD